ncbi:hypothetical protein ANO14919_100370 [Xylariales sp. No.14919]|nr:hypothetical protein ANO14919_100370 [Xylariales sp. No.14919]
MNILSIFNIVLAISGVAVSTPVPDSTKQLLARDGATEFDADLALLKKSIMPNNMNELE